ncbi:MAG: PEP-CTERM sorting domain-containing protein [Prosthecobacter sp.]
MPPSPTLFHASQRLLLVAGLCLGWAGLSRGIILYDTDNALANTSAPTGDYANSGWAYEGKYGGFLGTMIGPQYFITAQHFALQGSTFISTSTFNGVADVTYTIDTAANGGQGYWDIAGTDMRVLKINETFSSYATLYTGSAEVGSTLVTFGRGGPRGTAINVSGSEHGWEHTGSDGVARWGANQVDQIYSSGLGNMLRADFDAVTGQHESTLSAGDSGGGVFIEVSGQWYLAGVNYGVDNYFDTNATPNDFSEFPGAALYDMGGLYIGDDPSWQFITDTALDKPSSFYASRISDSALEIASIVSVPEPGSLGLLIISGCALMKRRRLSASSPQR